MSHYQEKFLTILNEDGVQVGSIPIPNGGTYRCMFSGEDVIYLDSEQRIVSAINFGGKVTMRFPRERTLSPTDLDRDGRGNIYVANADDNFRGVLCQFDAGGNYVSTLINMPFVYGIGINKAANLMNQAANLIAIAHLNGISIYHCKSEG